MRTIVDLPAEQIEALDYYAGEKDISRAEVVRQAVAAFLPCQKAQSSLDNHPAFGSLQVPADFDSVEHVRQLRAEWDDRG